MKRIIILFAIVVLLSSCDDSIKSHQIDEETQVEQSFADSTQWKDAKIMQPTKTKLYIQSGDVVYRFYGHAADGYILCLILGLAAGLIIGFSINKD